MKSYKLVISAFLTLNVLLTYAQSSKLEYQYTVDLTRVVEDRLYVELSTPKITTSETMFYLPKMIPGTYQIADFGRFVYELKALDKKGNPLLVEKIGENSWKIKDAQKLTKITYWIDDVIDTPKEGPTIYPMAATNIEEGKNFVINTGGFFGYFDGNKDVPFNINVIKDKEFYGSTGLIATRTDEPVTVLKLERKPENANKRVDRYQVENYDRLIDSPLMYAKPDTAVIRVANAEVLISCYSPTQKITAKEIAETLREVLMAQKEYLGGTLPVDKYAFIFYFTDKPITSYGALEHSYSSFYYMPEETLAEMKQQLRDFAAHEFFHIVTPLTIHSQEIHKFNFNEPEMSKHLWLYEGVTEYFAGNVQVKYGLITPQQYLTIIHDKIQTATYFKNDVPFTDISKFTLEKYGDQFLNVYLKGALIGMCIDIKLRKLSNGKYGLQNLIADLSKKYGKNQAFNDEELFTVIEKLTYPEIGDFLRKSVGGSEPLPFKDVLELAGVEYIDQRDGSALSLGFSNSALADYELEGKTYLSIAKIEGMNDQGKLLGFQVGDILVKINGEEIPSEGRGRFYQKQFAGLKEGGTLSYSLLRKDQSGTYKSVEVSAPIIRVKSIDRHIVSFKENPSPEQLTVRNSWLSK